MAVVSDESREHCGKNKKMLVIFLFVYFSKGLFLGVFKTSDCVAKCKWLRVNKNMISLTGSGEAVPKSHVSLAVLLRAATLDN